MPSPLDGWPWNGEFDDADALLTECLWWELYGDDDTPETDQVQ